MGFFSDLLLMNNPDHQRSEIFRSLYKTSMDQQLEVIVSGLNDTFMLDFLSVFIGESQTSTTTHCIGVRVCTNCARQLKQFGFI